MEQRSNDAALKDAQRMSYKEECVLGTGQEWNYAALKDAQVTLGKEEYALSTGKGEKMQQCALSME
jgi:hypothetical protein